PIVLLTVLALSLCWSLGIVTLVVGHLSIFSVMFLSIVVGLGTDYGVYLLLRNAEESALGRPAREALEVTAMRAGPGMLGGALAGVAAALSVFALHGVRFDYNLLNLQARGTESVDWEERILRAAGRSSFVALSTAGSLDELRERAAAFEGLASVSEVESVLS